MTTKVMKILTFIPILNIIVIFYGFFKRAANGLVAQAIIRMVIWLGIMVGAAALRAIATIAFAALGLPSVIGIIVTYVTIYLSLVAGAIVHMVGISDI
ncbi:MAG: hypothetical protein IJW49_01060 [Clostridia bacterium]|nr:hypothetical protein [Clostridia bacterium]